ncbi:glycosyltransferase family 2 protein [Paenibacillus silagei]|uniref:Glycosyltransferase family 2 protein n=1 Tax=Paenibacillus silagei TaxID=1670801 RepID=A0ABS4P205_9BACL|nr:glycosyltransferase family 2 protein [Paenibacillus silagei]MBP2116348.1 hypothetical protein [Paenibacillus silagei]
MEQDLVTIAILAKDKAHVLPLYLELIERQTYPASRINLYIRTNNNNDLTKEILEEWIARVGERYHEVHFDASDVEEPVQDYTPHEWNFIRLKVMGRVRQESVEWARSRNSHYFVPDCDNFIIPDTLESLLSTHLPVVGPLLTVAESPRSYYSNFHNVADDFGYFKPSELYFEYLYMKVKGLLQVDVIHCTYLMRREILEHVRYDDDSGRHEYVIVSDGLRKAGIPQYLDNRKHYGLLTFCDTEQQFSEVNLTVDNFL